MSGDGALDVQQAAEALAARLPEELAPLGRLAYNYRWAWMPDGDAFFRSLAALRWERSGQNPVRHLEEIAPARMRALARDPGILARMQSLVAALDADLARPVTPTPGLADGPLAFFCAEFGIHVSLPLYAGGLGVLAGDFLKEASDRALPVAGVGLFYWQGTFHQRLDPSGWQHEYWLELDPEQLPMVRVSDDDGRPLTITVPVAGRDIALYVWRVDVGRIPLFLLDANHPRNQPLDRWITARLYVGDREARLAQYAILGRGGIRALRAMGIDPALIHLNEGHAALAPAELVAEAVEHGASFDAALALVRGRTVFTTHTPIAAGNEVFPPGDITATASDLANQFGDDWQRLLDLGRVHPDDAYDPFGITPFSIRMSRQANAVSRRHGEVAREMWRMLWPGRPVEEIPIVHVTNGVHLPTWMAPAMQALLDRHLGDGWRRNPVDPASWAGIDGIPDEELWAVRGQLRDDLIRFVRERSVIDRLNRGDTTAYAQAAAQLWNAETLTVGFARRIATYKRLYLLAYDPARGLRLIQSGRPVQIALAGKAHPNDDEAKRSVQQLFGLARLPEAASHAAFLDDYDLALATMLVRGCDVWVNLPRPPLEASGTSGMKSALNGGLNLSVLDGWWAEAYDGDNGWGIEAPIGLEPPAQDAHDAAALLDILEFQVAPLFYDRGPDGIPHGWVKRIKASLRTVGSNFTTRRMTDDYMKLWAGPAAAGP